MKTTYDKLREGYINYFEAQRLLGDSEYEVDGIFMCKNPKQKEK